MAISKPAKTGKTGDRNRNPNPATKRAIKKGERARNRRMSMEVFGKKVRLIGHARNLDRFPSWPWKRDTEVPRYDIHMAPMGEVKGKGHVWFTGSDTPYCYATFKKGGFRIIVPLHYKDEGTVWELVK
jgi:hypothetical protein